jgi:hypothetical protein
MELISQRCRNHPSREAVARCPGCSRFFCRECISEHEGRVLCAACLAGILKKKIASGGRLTHFNRLLLAFAGIFAAWFFFDVLGHLLLRIPASFHEGTIWEKAAEEP